jgi:alanine dehydrogenase
MIVGVIKEIKNNEFRVAMTPSGAEQMVAHGHTVMIEKTGGEGSGFTDDMYVEAGAVIIDTAAEIFKKADMIMKVKEPLPSEYEMIRKGQILFTYLHFAAAEGLTRAMIKSDSIDIAYETVEKPNRSLPLLVPMSEVAGRMSVQEGAKYLEKTFGGCGKLLAGVPGVEPASVLVIGAGIVGTQAAKVAAGVGANVTIVDINLDRLRYLDDVMPANVTTLMSSPHNIRKLLPDVDLLVGAVLIPGAKAPKLVTADMIKLMKKGSVIVDVAIDQGGCVETSHATTHEDPIYDVDGVIHYCVANIPGAVAYTSTKALTNATLPYALQLADKGWKKALKENADLAKGANIINGKVTYKGVADAFDLEYTDIDTLL